MSEIRLTPRENAVLDAFLNSRGGGSTNKHIARYLDVCESTVKVHFKAILRATGCHTRAEVAVWWLTNHVEDPGPGIRT